MSTRPSRERPWPDLVRRLAPSIRRAARVLDGSLHRTRRFRLLSGVRLRAMWARALVDVDVARDLRLGRRVRVAVSSRERSVIRIAPHCVLGEDTFVSLRGGQLLLGEGVEFRPRCQLQVTGRLEVEGPALLQHGASLHCDESITIGRRAVLSEYVTVVDSSHGTNEDERWFLDVVRTAPVVIGAGAWVGAKATIGKGVRIGEGSIVSANSLVIKDVAPQWLVSGVPATEVHRLADDESPSRSLFGDRPVA